MARSIADQFRALHQAEDEVTQSCEELHPLDEMTKALHDDMDLEKGGGEGSRGGHVIGHTSSGKPIYAKGNTKTHQTFSEQDHHDAAALHEKAAAAEHKRYMTTPEDEGGRDASEKKKRHRFLADRHKKEAFRANRHGANYGTNAPVKGRDYDVKVKKKRSEEKKPGPYTGKLPDDSEWGDFRTGGSKGPTEQEKREHLGRIGYKGEAKKSEVTTDNVLSPPDGLFKSFVGVDERRANRPRFRAPRRNNLKLID